MKCELCNTEINDGTLCNFCWELKKRVEDRPDLVFDIFDFMLSWEAKDGLEPVFVEDFWYDISWGGYIKPESILKDKKLSTILKRSVEIVRDFEGWLQNESEEIL